MPSLRSWFPIPRGSHFSLANIPFGIISTALSPEPRVAVAIGGHVFDLKVFAENSGFSSLPEIQTHEAVFSQSSLNAFAALGRPIHGSVRGFIQRIFSEETPYPDVLKTNSYLIKQVLHPLGSVKMHVPFKIGDYTDFYAGLNHAFNVGSLFRDPANALQPNYKYLPVGYHGRASSVVVSGTPIRRPCGQITESPGSKVPIFSPCRRLDIELELGAFVCKDNAMGEPVPIAKAEEHIFGVVLMNDWSARDVQAWEYIPLGPFNSKNFGTTISPWVVLTDALEPFLSTGIENDVEVLSYLKESRSKNIYDINLKVELKTPSGNTTTITETSSKNLLWSFPQMLAHHSITGCPMNAGDLLGSGTISGLEPNARGSLLEQNQSGKVSIKLSGGEERKFLEDGDEVTITGVCGSDENALVGFGSCIGKIEPALKI